LSSDFSLKQKAGEAVWRLKGHIVDKQQKRWHHEV